MATPHFTHTHPSYQMQQCGLPNSIFIMHDHIESVQLLLNICGTLYFARCAFDSKNGGGVDKIKNLSNCEHRTYRSLITLEILNPIIRNIFFHESSISTSTESHHQLPFSFFTDTPSTSRILPLVTPNSLQITSRGRVAFNIIPVGQLGIYKTPTTSGDVIMDFLSPEFVQTLATQTHQRSATFSESDIEKVTLIYSAAVIHLQGMRW